MDRASGAASRFPSQGHEVKAFRLAHFEGFEQLAIVSLLSRNASTTHRNINIFFLQWVSYRHVESRGREAAMVLLCLGFFSTTTADNPALAV